MLKKRQTAPFHSFNRLFWPGICPGRQLAALPAGPAGPAKSRLPPAALRPRRRAPGLPKAAASIISIKGKRGFPVPL